MDANPLEQTLPPSHEVIAPRRRSLPLVFSSPHSGDDYPADFLAASRLSALELRRSEDSFVDELFCAAPEEGAPLLRALFPRAYVDPNREPFELDQAMFADPLPTYANTRSPRVASGLGTIARIVASGAEIYRDKLSFDEACARIHRHYWPYHTTLRQLVDETRADFGFCILIDCHSMPSHGVAMNGHKVASDLDVVLGDGHGQSCASAVIDCVEASLTAMGYRVGRNDPYSGGFVTRHYGRPSEGVHALQIEISRKLYMDEARIERSPELQRMKKDLRHVILALAKCAGQGLVP
jgi:N-formylglutamate amidohydrolase